MESSGTHFGSSSFAPSAQASLAAHDYKNTVKFLAEKKTFSDLTQKGQKTSPETVRDLERNRAEIAQKIQDLEKTGEINLQDGLNHQEMQKLGFKWQKVDEFVDGHSTEGYDQKTDGNITEEEAAKYLWGADLWAQLKYQNKYQMNPEDARMRASFDYIYSNSYGNHDLRLALDRAEKNFNFLNDNDKFNSNMTLKELLELPYDEKEGAGFENKFQSMLKGHEVKEFGKQLDEQLGDQARAIGKDAACYQEYLRMGFEEGPAGGSDVPGTGGAGGLGRGNGLGNGIVGNGRGIDADNGIAGNGLGAGQVVNVEEGSIDLILDPNSKPTF